MKKYFISLALLCACGALHASEWGYAPNNGPSKWASLSPDYATCKSGQSQSPIDITGKTITQAENALALQFEDQAKDIINNGHSVQVNFDNGAGGSVRFKNEEYTLTQLHFHTPSETHIKGQTFPMEMHLVSQNKEGKLLVTSLLFKEGKENAALQSIIKNAPKKQGETKPLGEIKLTELLPQNLGYYAFSGSLTTPPCSENVQWVVLKTPVNASQRQIMAVRTIIHNDARPLQPLNGRVIESAEYVKDTMSQHDIESTEH